ncbi:MAG: TIGR02147 family protein [Fibrobacteria bacterium]
MPNPFADIYSFTDYRPFLALYIQERGKADKSFTQARICRQLGLPNSRSFLGDVIRGFKPLTATKAEGLIGILELKGDEAKYFRALVLYNQSGIPSEKEFYLDQLISLNRSPTAILDKMAFAYYTQWYHSTIRATLDIVDVKDDLNVLARKIVPKLSLGKIKSSFALLKNLELIRRDANGNWKPTEKSLHSGPYAQDEIIKRYQVECLEISKSAVLSANGHARNISTETLSIAAEDYRLIEDKLQRFKSEIRAIVRKSAHGADRVYQLNVQLFPQTE